MLAFLRGKKTFIIAGLIFAGALGKFLAAGDYSETADLNFLLSQSVEFSMLATTLRLALLGK